MTKEKEVFPVYLDNARRGLYALVNGKRYFVDRRYESVLNHEGIAFCFVTKDKEKYGFLGGSYDFDGESVKNAELLSTILCDSALFRVYRYKGFDFYMIDNNIYYFSSDRLKPVRKLNVPMNMWYNILVTDTILDNGTNVTVDYILKYGDDLSNINIKEIAMILKYSLRSGIKSIKITGSRLISVDKDFYTDYYAIFGGIVVRVSLTEVDSSIEYVEMYDKVKEFVRSNNISNSWLTDEDGLVVNEVRFLNVTKTLLMFPLSSDDSVYNEFNRERVEKSVREYKEWLSGLKKYVTAKNAKDYMKIQLDNYYFL